MKNPEEQDLVRSARRLFDNSVEQLDTQTQSAIVRRRQQALQGAGASIPRSLFPKLLVPAGGLATIAMAVLLFSLSNGHSRGELQAEDLEMLSSSESLEFYEDLEFYQWLDDNDLTS